VTDLRVDGIRSTAIQQNFTVLKRVQAKYIDVNLYMHKDPAGIVKVALKNGATELASQTTTIAAIKAAASLSDNQYHWGWIQFILNKEVFLDIDTTYTIEVTVSGYTYADAVYWGVVMNHENPINTITDGGITYLDYRPYDIKVWAFEGI